MVFSKVVYHGIAKKYAKYINVIICANKVLPGLTDCVPRYPREMNATINMRSAKRLNRPL